AEGSNPSVPTPPHLGGGEHRFFYMSTRERETEQRPLPDEAPPEDAPMPQPEREEPRLRDPGLRDLSLRDWRAIFVRAFKGFLAHNGAMLHSALPDSAVFAKSSLPPL